MEDDFVGYVQRSINEEEEFHFLRFEFLQRLNITQLQVKLARTKNEIQKNKKISEDDREKLRHNLQDYGSIQPDL